MLCLEISWSAKSLKGKIYLHMSSLMDDPDSLWDFGSLALWVILDLHGFSLDVKPHAILTLRIHENCQSDWPDGCPS
jgi:hypothetical protein